jgi:hypothetical protein
VILLYGSFWKRRKRSIRTWCPLCTRRRPQMAVPSGCRPFPRLCTFQPRCPVPRSGPTVTLTERSVAP